MSGDDTANPPRFREGDEVRVDDRPVEGHCRAPWYLRGRTGTIVEVQGVYRDPERLAYHLSGLPAQVLYKVRFAQARLWPGYAGSSRDHVEADIYESWLKGA